MGLEVGDLLGSQLRDDGFGGLLVDWASNVIVK